MPELAYLYDHAKGEALDAFKLQAALQGIDLDKSGKSADGKKRASPVLFKDPKEYEKLTPQQREQETQELMKRMKIFAADPVTFTAHGGGNG